MSDPADLIARISARYDGGDGEAARLTAEALARLAWRKRRGGKVCVRCGQARQVGDFARDSRRPDGLAYACRSCEAARVRASRRPV
ncbi:hypothetical protein SEA_MAGUCO_61 [Arthrobacter phage MaGuCo]|uniref:HNH endonuclease n=1 Tax=Arthrobacter phage MaGuCo TaxID=3038363 RepID=A0AAF0GFE5_9CAUD|nr:hypothetical protein SEA_MAGUCO_61 [Arthrobacter phage MaGuCo]